MGSSHRKVMVMPIPFAVCDSSQRGIVYHAFHLPPHDPEGPIDKVAEIKRDEALILAAVGLCFGLAIMGNQLGFSVAIGAFLIGVVMASSKASGKKSYV